MASMLRAVGARHVSTDANDDELIASNSTTARPLPTTGSPRMLRVSLAFYGLFRPIPVVPNPAKA
jgi:hypothetical protein